MTDIVDLIIECYEKGVLSSSFSCSRELSSEDVRVVMIEILSWLKLEHKRELWLKEGKRTGMKPLLLDQNYLWCKNLRGIVSEEGLFNQYFCINGNQFNFSSNIMEDERKEARKKAFDYYNPQKRS